MSQSHATLAFSTGYPTLRDLRSTNGTFVEREGEVVRLVSGVDYRVRSPVMGCTDKS